MKFKINDRVRVTCTCQYCMIKKINGKTGVVIGVAQWKNPKKYDKEYRVELSNSGELQWYNRRHLEPVPSMNRNNANE